jgi:hypothetical protein
MRRRSALALGITGAVAAGGGGLLAYGWASAARDTFGRIDFDTPLAIPPLAASTADGSGARVFDLEIQAGKTQFKDGPATDTWGINGAYLARPSGPGGARRSRSRSATVSTRRPRSTGTACTCPP